MPESHTYISSSYSSSQLLARESSQPIFQLNVHGGKLRFANKAFLQMVGYQYELKIEEVPFSAIIEANSKQQELSAILVEMLDLPEGSAKDIPVLLFHRLSSTPVEGLLRCWITSEGGDRFWQGVISQMPEKLPNAKLSQQSSNEEELLFDHLRVSLSGLKGQEFLETMCKELMRELKADYVFVSLLSDHQEMKTRVLVSAKGIEPNIRYSLNDSPSSQIMLSGGVLAFSEHLMDSFPNSGKLQQMGAQVYVGGAFFNQQNIPVGELSVVFSKPINYANFVKSIITICARRVGQVLLQEYSEVKRDHSVLELVSDVPAVIYRCSADANRRVTFVNERIAPMLGYSPDEVTQTIDGWSELIHPDDQEKVNLDLRQSYMSQEHYFFEYRLKHKDGRLIWVYDSGRIVEDPIEGWTLEGILQDITAQKVAEESLTESEYKYHALVGAISEGIIMLDVNGNVIACNQAAQEILGTSYQELMGSNANKLPWDICDESGNPIAKEDLPSAKTMREKKSVHQVISISREDRDKIWININTELVYSQSGFPSAVVATLTDITDSYQTQERLQSSELRFRVLFNSIVYPILMINMKGRIMMANPAVNQCFGYPSVALNGLSVDRLFSSKETMYAFTRLFFKGKEFIGGDSSSPVEMLGLRSDGSELPLEVQVSELQVEGQPYLLCMLRDMSQDKRYIELEKAHKKMTDSLRYAQRIQMAQLGNYQEILGSFKDAVIFFSPKDIVSGDFYWFSHIQQLKFDEKTMQSSSISLKVLVAGDCTGHGVPGAFMAALGNAYLHEIVNEHHIIEPHRILSVLDQKIVSTLQKRGNVNTDDGMDMGVIVLDEENQTLTYSGAKHPLYMMRDGELQMIKGTSLSLGGKKHKKIISKRFEKHVIETKPGDRFYMCSDGFQDQFGGMEGRKYMRRRFKELLLHLLETPMNEQIEAFAMELNDWKGLNTPQTDDILILGIEV